MNKPKQVTVDGVKRALTQDDIDTITALLLAGERADAVSECYGHSPAWAWHIAQDAGLKWEKHKKYWYRPEQNGDGWNLPLDEYTELLGSERQNGHSIPDAAFPEPLPFADDEDETSRLLNEAHGLLAALNSRWEADQTVIAELRAEIGVLATERDDLRSQNHILQHKADLWDERKRADDARRRELSKGPLRSLISDVKRNLGMEVERG